MKFLHKNINRASLRVLKKIEWAKLKLKNDISKTNIALLSTFTADPIVPYLGCNLSEIGINANIWSAPYNQVIQQCLNPESETYKFKPDIIIIWPRFEDISGQPITADETGLNTIYNTAIEIVDAGIKAATALNAKLIFVLPGIIDQIPFGLGDDNAVDGIYSACANIRQIMRQKLVESNSARIMDLEQIVRKLGSRNTMNPSLYFAAKIPFSEELFDFASEKLGQLIKDAAHKEAKKIIAIDPENIIWSTTTNDENAKQTEPLNYFGAYLASLKGPGVQIALITSENKAVAKEKFKKQEFVKEHLFDYWFFDATNYGTIISNLAQQVNTDSGNMLFVSTKQGLIEEPEREQLKITYLLLEEEPSNWVPVINDLNFISFLPKFNLQFSGKINGVSSAKADSSGLEGFLASLKLEVELSLCQEHDYSQIEHLVEASHDFNISARKKTIEELKAYKSGDIYSVKVRDRFGDYGLSGTLITENKGDEVFIDSFIMNCRVLGKNAEYRVLEKFVEIQKTQGNKNLVFEYIKTDRNGAAKKFLTQLVPENYIKESESGFIVTINSLDLSKLIEKTDKNQVSSCSVQESHKTTNSVVKADFIENFISSRIQKFGPVEYGKLLTETAKINSNIDSVLTAVQQYHQRKRPNQAVAYVAPRTETESVIVEIWQKIIGIDKVGVHDNFFSIGGHSILATQLILYFEKAFQLKLPIRLFFENPTVAMIAQTVENMKKAPDHKDNDEVAVSNFRYITSTFLKNEVYLDESIHPGNAKRMSSDYQMKNIFLTGATGFLGAFILYHLLKKTDAAIYCLARGKNGKPAPERIKENLKFYFLWSNDFAGRIVTVEGDLQEPMLGLPNSKYEWLCDEIDVIYHCGAVTNFIDPYQKMKNANVLGTQEILRIACHKKVKPVHYISTHYVFSTLSHTKDEWIKEEALPDHNEILTLGYQQSKWVGEHLVDIARQRGLPANIYRPGRISGDSKTGACQTKDFIWMMIKTCIEANSLFDRDLAMGFIPVDFVSEATVGLSLRKENLNKNFHLVNEDSPTLKDIYKWVVNYGYQVEKFTYEGWYEKMLKMAQENEESTIKYMLTFLPNEVKEWDIDLNFDSQQAQDGLEKLSIACNKIDEKVFKKYLDFFIESGFLKKPLKEELV